MFLSIAANSLIVLVSFLSHGGSRRFKSYSAHHRVKTGKFFLPFLWLAGVAVSLYRPYEPGDWGSSAASRTRRIKSSKSNGGPWRTIPTPIHSIGTSAMGAEDGIIHFTLIDFTLIDPGG
jgi:hypothetical protein